MGKIRPTFLLIDGSILMSEISVCIPTYEYGGDGVKYLIELFDSLAAQTMQDFDLVISDHSIDNTIRNFCETCDYDFDITYIQNLNGRGYQAPNTNCALNNAEGRILKIIYQDDIFVDNEALEKIKNTFDLTECKWLFHGFTHTIDGIKTYRDCVPEWTEMMLEGNNHLGSPSCVAFLNGYQLDMDENMKLLIDTELYHRMRIKYGLPEIISDILIANREHDNRVSSNGVEYDGILQTKDGKRWLVNRKELQYIHEKHKDFFGVKKYPDEN